jgi:hypothetical protein
MFEFAAVNCEHDASSLCSVILCMCMYVCMYVCMRGGPKDPALAPRPSMIYCASPF